MRRVHGSKGQRAKGEEQRAKGEEQRAKSEELRVLFLALRPLPFPLRLRHCCALREDAFLEMPFLLGETCCMWIVSDEHDRLLHLAI